MWNDYDTTVSENPAVTRLANIVAECSFMDYTFHVEMDGRGAIYLQGSYMEPDIDTKVVEEQRTRRWFLSPEMTKSEVVQTVFKCCITSMEHRTREHFTYRDRRVFGPHFNIDALWTICDQLDHRG